MTTLVRTEFRKLLTTKLWWTMLLGSLAVTALAVVATILGEDAESDPTQSLASPEIQRAVFGTSGVSGVFIMIVGIIMVTTEYRYFTSRPTFLFEPHRWKVVVAKLVTGAGMGLVYSVLCAGLATAIALPWLSAKDIDVSMTENGIPDTLAGTIAMVAIYGVIGVGAGVLLRSQILAVTATLAYLLVIEPLVRSIPGVQEAYPYLMGGVAEALSDSTPEEFSVDLLGQWAAGAAFLGWGLLFAVLGSWLSVRRDVP